MTTQTTTDSGDISTGESILEEINQNILQNKLGELVLLINRDKLRQTIYHQERYFLGRLTEERVLKVVDGQDESDQGEVSYFLPTRFYVSPTEDEFKDGYNISLVNENIPITLESLEALNHINQHLGYQERISENRYFSEIIVGDKLAIDWFIKKNMAITFYMLAVKLGRPIDDVRVNERVYEYQKEHFILLDKTLKEIEEKSIANQTELEKIARITVRDLCNLGFSKEDIKKRLREMHDNVLREFDHLWN